MGRIHVVVQGECLSRIAAKYGIYDWRTIYEDADNRDLRKRRPNPNILFPGDRVHIPDLQAKAEQAATGNKHVYVINRFRKQLRIVFKNARGELFDNESYLLRFDSGRVRDGRTNGAALLEEMVEPDESAATILIVGRVLHLALGHLNPTGDVKKEDMSGIQARLNNLGYTAGPNDGVYGRNTRAALALVQCDHKLDVIGLPDEQTLAKLEDLHGC